ncbi:MAG: hypothetical protein HZB43_04260 [candidate division Zixibacteria bacterium]|nr:hypothetical protein [candidate division Zixibacteria bacterium]
MPATTLNDPTQTVNDSGRSPVPTPRPGEIELRTSEAIGEDQPGQPTVLKWADRRHSGQGIVAGIEFDGNRLVVVGITRSGRSRTLHRFLAAEFEKTPSRADIAKLLQEFDPSPKVRAQVAVSASRGVVRQFALPLIPKRQRLAAAIWEGQKLIPFSLKADEALFGFSFTPGPNKNLTVTLVAVPRTDAETVLGAVDDAGWRLEGVTITGANRPLSKAATLAKDSDEQVVASAVWTMSRGSFMVFRRGQLQFQYDLGPTQGLNARLGSAPEAGPAVAASWIKDMGRSIGDALEFHSGAYPQFAPDRLELMGLPQAVAPLITDWQERLGLPVTVFDALEPLTERLPAPVGEWVRANPGLLTVAALAASGQTTIDLSPPKLVAARKHHLINSIGRAVFIFSVASMLAWTVLLWTQLNMANRAASVAAHELYSLQHSGPAAEVERVSGLLTGIGTLNRDLTARAHPWMPLVKSITSTVPAGAELATLSFEASESEIPGIVMPSARLEGKLGPSDRPHSLIYADWIGRINRFTGEGSARVVSDRTVDWHGKRYASFVVEIRPPGTTQGAAK